MLEITLIDWPTDGGGPRFLGDLNDSDLVKQVQERLAAKYRRRLARLAGPAHLVPSPLDSELASEAAAKDRESGQATDGRRGPNG